MEKGVTVCGAVGDIPKKHQKKRFQERNTLIHFLALQFSSGRHSSSFKFVPNDKNLHQYHSLIHSLNNKDDEKEEKKIKGKNELGPLTLIEFAVTATSLGKAHTNT